MSSDDQNGLSYLTALKRSEVMENPGRNLAQAHSVGPISLETGTRAGSRSDFASLEKRRSPRYKCEGSAEMRDLTSEARTWATFTDVSMHGCYVEAAATYAVGTELQLILEAKGFQVQMKAKVRVNYPSLGMGIAFTEISDEDRARLKQLLQTLSRPSVIMTPGLPAPRNRESRAQIANPAAALQDMLDFFESRSMLMREEFLAILRKSQATPPAPRPRR